MQMIIHWINAAHSVFALRALRCNLSPSSRARPLTALTGQAPPTSVQDYLYLQGVYKNPNSIKSVQNHRVLKKLNKLPLVVWKSEKCTFSSPLICSISLRQSGVWCCHQVCPSGFGVCKVLSGYQDGCQPLHYTLSELVIDANKTG